jgi:hypothetical protein
MWATSHGGAGRNETSKVLQSFEVLTSHRTVPAKEDRSLLLGTGQRFYGDQILGLTLSRQPR